MHRRRARHALSDGGLEGRRAIRLTESRMMTIEFHSGLTFDQVREFLTQLNEPANRGQIARLTWREGTAKDQSVLYLYDPMADRFGHKIDKESISVEIVSSLLNGIPVAVDLHPEPKGYHPEWGSSAPEPQL
jgi:hypothetical protein